MYLPKVRFLYIMEAAAENEFVHVETSLVKGKIRKGLTFYSVCAHRFKTSSVCSFKIQCKPRMPFMEWHLHRYGRSYGDKRDVYLNVSYESEKVPAVGDRVTRPLYCTKDIGWFAAGLAHARDSV